MCRPGSYAQSPDSPACLPCPEGTYSSSWGSSQCSHCITGTFSSSEVCLAAAVLPPQPHPTFSLLMPLHFRVPLTSVQRYQCCAITAISCSQTCLWNACSALSLLLGPALPLLPSPALPFLLCPALPCLVLPCPCCLALSCPALAAWPCPALPCQLPAV